MEHPRKPERTRRMKETKLSDLSRHREAVSRLEAGNREHDQAIAAGADLALDVTEILDRDLVFLGASRAENRDLPHAGHRGPRGDGLLNARGSPRSAACRVGPSRRRARA